MIASDKKVVLLDLDNTLTDTEKNSRNAMRLMYDELGLSAQFPVFERFWEIYHTCNDELWGQYRKGTLNKEKLNELRFSWPLELMGVKNSLLCQQINDTFYKHFLPQHEVMPGAYELLDYLSKKYRLAIVSNGTKSSQIVKMKVFGFNPYFEYMFLSDDVGFPKPDIRIYNYVLGRLGVSASEAVMIGDDFEGDVVGAANAGIDQVWYNYLNLPIPTKSFQPSHIISKLLDLKEYL